MKVVNIPLVNIDEDKEQPRTSFDEESIGELAESIKKVGLLNPIKVRRIGNRYQIIFGNRRFKACLKLGFKEIPCILSENNDELEIYLEQLTENIQRESFTPVEEALAFQKIIDEHNWSIKMLSGQLGKHERYISRKIDLLVFGQSVRKIIHGKKDIIPDALNEEQALKLKHVPIEYRDHVALKVAKDGASVKDTERIAHLFLDKNISSASKEKLLGLQCKDMISIWTENEISKTRLAEDNKINSKNLSLVNQKESQKSPNEDKIIEDQIYNISPLQEKAELIMARIPSFCPMPSDLISNIDDMTIETRDNFYETVNILTNTLAAHLEEWNCVKDLLEKKMSSRTNIKLIKS